MVSSRERTHRINDEHIPSDDISLTKVHHGILFDRRLMLPSVVYKILVIWIYTDEPRYFELAGEQKIV